jgi:hypothetical protein
MERTVLWVLTPSSSERTRYFGRKYGKLLQGRKVSKYCLLFSAGFPLGFIFDHEDVGNAILRNVRFLESNVII